MRDRGDLTLWISQDVIESWTPSKTGKQGGQPLSSDLAIETALTLRLLFRLPLWQTEGFLCSVLTLLALDLPCPDHTTLSRRNATVEISRLDDRESQGPVDLIVEKHAPGVNVIIPPRKDAVLSATASTAPTQRDQHLLAIESEGRFAWQRTSGYDAQADTENPFSRYKRTFGGGLRAKRDEVQDREASLACQLLNRMRELGRPQSYPVSEKRRSWGQCEGSARFMQQTRMPMKTGFYWPPGTAAAMV